MSAAVAQSLRVQSRRIVERDCHIATTLRQCVYHVITRLRGGRAGYRRLSRDERRALWQGAREGRRGNINLYQLAMRGTA